MYSLTIVAMLASFLAETILATWLGGSAVYGYIEGGRYFLMVHGHRSAVTGLQYYAVAAMEILVFASWPTRFMLAARGRLVPDPGGSDGAGQQRDAADENAIA